MKRSLVFGCLFLLLNASSPSPASAIVDGDWTSFIPSGVVPSIRDQHGCAYDPIDGRMILFGSGEETNDLWSLDLAAASPSWTHLVLNPSPIGRKAMSMVYDPLRNRVLMFGGYGGGQYLGDLWELRLGTNPEWHQLHPSGPLPSGRMFSLAVYDPVRDRMILFGGHPTFLNDVWALSLAEPPTWVQLQSAGAPPSPRYGHAGIYDPEGDRMIVFGGRTETAETNDTWALSLSGTPTWNRIVTAGAIPSVRALASTIHDPLRNRMVLFAGSNTNDTWSLALDGTAEWSHLIPTGSAPLPRQAHTAVYDAAEDRMVVFGGAAEENGRVHLLDWGSPAGSPVITSTSPAGGRVGDDVLIHGYHLANATEVRFGSVIAPILQNTNSSVRTQVPVDAVTSAITVVTVNGTAVSPDEFIVGELPVISSAAPDSGRVGMVVSLTGHHFTGADRVSFGDGGDAVFSVVADSLVMVTVNEGAHTGFIGVRTAIGTGLSPFQFRVIPPDTLPHLLSVRDVPRDEGGFVQLRWSASDFDDRIHHDILEYRVWKRALSSFPGMRARRIGRLSDFWEPVGTVPAAFFSGYAYTANTPFDSVAADPGYLTFVVQALTRDPLRFYFSNIDSGYSVDNLAPPAPPSPMAERVGSTVSVHWKPVNAVDLNLYRVHRGTTPDFVASEANAIGETADTAFVDDAAVPALPYYRIAAVDVHGNASVGAEGHPDQPVGTLMALVHYESRPGLITLEWRGVTLAGAEYLLQRRTLSTEWDALGTPRRVDSQGEVRVEDMTAPGGQRVGYRLVSPEQRGIALTSEVWIDVPALAFGMSAPAPNPARASSSISFVLESDADATLKLIDIGGRTVFTRDVGHLGRGAHVTRLAALQDVRPGVYQVILTQGGRRATGRLAIIR